MNAKIAENTTVADIVNHYPQTRPLLEEMGVDYCCGGKQPLKDACTRAEQPVDEVIEKLNNAITHAPSQNQSNENWTDASLTDLARHIIDAHHAYLKESLPRLKRLAEKVYQVHQPHHGKMLAKLNQAFESLRTDIEMHLAKEERILFPLIQELEAYGAGRGPVPDIHCGSIENPIRQMEYEHDVAGEILATMRKLTDDYTAPPDACESFKALYDGLAGLEKDLHEHIHLENNILFPRAAELEGTLEF